MTLAPFAAGAAVAEEEASSLSDLAARHLQPSLDEIVVRGYAKAGDGGGARYRRVRAEPRHIAKVRSADGAWWEIIPDEKGFVSSFQIGCFGDGPAQDVTPLFNSVLSAPTLGRLRLLRQRGDFYHAASGPIWVHSGGGIVGEGFGQPNTADYGTLLVGGPNRLPHQPVVGNATRRPQTDAGRDREITLTGFTVDGDRARNASGQEWSHGVQLNAADGVVLDMRAVNCRGDGLTLQSGYEANGRGFSDPICRNIRGHFVSERNGRQGVALTGCEDFDLELEAYGNDLFAFDIETDQEAHIVRRGRVRLRAIGNGNGSNSSGGMGLYGLPNRRASDVDITFLVESVPVGSCGMMFRDIEGFRLKGVFRDVRGDVYVGGAEGLGAGSQVFIDHDLYDVAGLGRLWDAGGRIDGAIRVHNRLSATPLQLREYAGGQITVDLSLGSSESGAPGVILNRTSNITLHGRVASFSGAGVVLEGGASNNSIYADVSGNTVDGHEMGIVEALGCRNNHAFGQKDGVKAMLTGPTSSIEYASGGVYSAPSPLEVLPFAPWLRDREPGPVAETALPPF